MKNNPAINIPSWLELAAQRNTAQISVLLDAISSEEITRQPIDIWLSINHHPRTLDHHLAAQLLPNLISVFYLLTGPQFTVARPLSVRWWFADPSVCWSSFFFPFDLEAYRKVAGVGNSVHDIEPTSCLFF